MARLSSGLRNAIALQYGFGVMMNGGIIRVYAGTAPATPDDPPGSSEIARITTEGKTFIPVTDPDGAGLLLALAGTGVLVNSGEWRLKGVANGVPSWWRWYWLEEDSLLASTYYPRVDGSVGTELVLATSYITPTTDVIIDSFSFTLPMGL